jgi:hypothetical protein
LQRSLAARTSRGKTAFALNVAHSVVTRTNEAVVVFSQEMNKQEINDRLICLAGRISFADIKSREDIDRVREAFNAAADLPIYIRDAAATVPAIHAKVRRLMTRRKVAPVIIDYLQLLTPAGRFRESYTGSFRYVARIEVDRSGTGSSISGVVTAQTVRRKQGTGPQRPSRVGIYRAGRKHGNVSSLRPGIRRPRGEHAGTDAADPGEATQWPGRASGGVVRTPYWALHGNHRSGG